MLQCGKLIDFGFIFNQAVSLTGSFNLWLVLAIFLITLIAEFGFSIPYLLESIWLLIGYSVSIDAISPGSVVIFCLIGLTGREIGASVLYRVSGYGSTPVLKIYDKLSALSPDWQRSRNPLKSNILLPLARFINRLIIAKLKVNEIEKGQEKAFFAKFTCKTPLSVAMGRFTWLKLPITITMGMARKLLILLTGVALFSLAWDSLYILIGVFGAGSKIGSTSMLIYTISGFIALQAIVFLIRRWITSRRLAYAKL